MKRTVLISAVSGIVFLSACSPTENSPGVEYMPDMYRSPAVEAYVDYENDSVMSARKPVPGTVPFGKTPMEYINNMPYTYPDTPEGLAAATSGLKNPLPFTEQMVEDGKTLYGKFCVHCHGAEGNGDGSMVQNDKFPPPPMYSSIEGLTEGRIFHVITYGKGLMGPHASQLNKVERWKLAYYVQQLVSGDASGKQKSDTTAENAVMPNDSLHQAAAQ